MTLVRALIEDTDAADTPTRLLRAPAAVVAAAYIAGLLTGAVARPALTAPSAGVVFLLTAFVCGPFLLPTRWFRRQPSLLWGWMFAAAVMATTRAVTMAAWLYPRLPLDAWFVKAVVDLVVCALLWTAAIAVWRSSRPPLAQRLGSR